MNLRANVIFALLLVPFGIGAQEARPLPSATSGTRRTFCWWWRIRMTRWRDAVSCRAIYDEHKRVAVVFATRGGSGGNDYSREHGPALADIPRARGEAGLRRIGITNVWFLDGKDTLRRTF